MYQALPDDVDRESKRSALWWIVVIGVSMVAIGGIAGIVYVCTRKTEEGTRSGESADTTGTALPAGPAKPESPITEPNDKTPEAESGKTNSWLKKLGCGAVAAGATAAAYNKTQGTTPPASSKPSSFHTVGFDFDGVCHRSVWFQSNGQGHPIRDVYEWGSKRAYPDKIQIALNASSNPVRHTSGKDTFDVSRTLQTNNNTGATRKVSKRAVTHADLVPNKTVLAKIRGYLQSGVKVIILTHNGQFAAKNGGSCLIQRFLQKHIGMQADEVRVANNPHAKSWHIKELGIQEFHDDSVNICKEVKKNAPGVKLWRVFPKKYGTSTLKLY